MVSVSALFAVSRVLFEPSSVSEKDSKNGVKVKSTLYFPVTFSYAEIFIVYVPAEIYNFSLKLPL